VKLVILYFSGTGNTDYVARYLARHLAPRLAGLSVEIELRSIDQQPAETLAEFDVLAVGFPVYACESPPFFQAYLARLAPGAGRGAFVFCTKGALAGNAVRRNLQRLAEQGYVPLGGAAVGMPGSDGLAMVGKDSWMARSALNKDYDHLKDADRLVKRMAEVLTRLTSGESVTACRQPLPWTVSGVLLDRVWALLYRLFADPFRTRLRADARCTGCGLCVRLCPVDNVELYDGHAHFADGCVLCLRCLHNCPQEAIQIGNMTVDKFRWHGPRGDFRSILTAKNHPSQERPVGSLSEGVRSDG
jgi:ferredoxin